MRGRGLPVQDGGSSDLSGQSYFPSQYSSSWMHPPVDLHMYSDMRQDSVGMTTVQLINSMTISQLITAAAQVVITVAVASADSDDYDDTMLC